MNEKGRDSSLDRLLAAAFRGSLGDGSDACPDAEALAAWCENGLPQPQLKEIEAHLAGCGRCQAHVAALARSATAAEAASAPESAWVSWRWLVPAAVGATALALLIYVQPDALRRTKTEQKEASQASKVESSPNPPAAQRRFDSRPDSRSDSASTSPMPLGQATQAKKPNETPSRSQDRQPRPERPVRQDNESARVAEGALPAAPAPSTQTAKATTTRDSVGARAVPPTDQARNVATEAVPSVEIASSDPAIRWRIRGADVERTIDGGVTWTKQSTGTPVQLTAGAAPSPSVCWLVGRRGTVLRSADGRTWQTVPFPEPIDLVGVEATGPETASVTAVDGRRFTTADGGKSWTSGRVQEF